MDEFIYKPEGKIRIENLSAHGRSHELEKQAIKEVLKKNSKEIAIMQEKMYACDKWAMLIILQAMDAAGKDGVIRTVLKGINPMGCQVKSFRTPSQEELDHDFLWRCSKALPGRGNIGIFNRSYYEDVLVSKVHRSILEKTRIPALPCDEKEEKKFWLSRYQDINNFENHLINNGTLVLKIFLNISKEEQRKRFLNRINDPDKNWKFSSTDLLERKHWNKYMKAYQDMLENTSTEIAPWHVVPADSKWFSRLVVSNLICEKLKSLNLDFPEISEDKKLKLEESRKLLENE